MFKHIILILALSVAIVMATPYAQQIIQWLLLAHSWINNMLTNIFTGGEAGNIVRELIALLSMPILIGLIPAILYWMVRRHWFPWFMEIVWIVWLLQAGALLSTAQTTAMAVTGA